MREVAETGAPRLSPAGEGARDQSPLDRLGKAPGISFASTRQAWSLAIPDTGSFAYYSRAVDGHEDEWPHDSDWLGEVRAFGAERY